MMNEQKNCASSCSNNEGRKKKDREYAVVVFTNESDPSSETVSPVPTIWLTPRKTNCYWPAGPNVSLYIKRYENPSPLWDVHSVRLEGLFGSYQEAINHENADNFAQRGRGLRAVKHLMPYSPDEDLVKGNKKKFKKTVGVVPPSIPSSLLQPTSLPSGSGTRPLVINESQNDSANINGIVDTYVHNILRTPSRDIHFEGTQQHNDANFDTSLGDYPEETIERTDLTDLDQSVLFSENRNSSSFSTCKCDKVLNILADVSIKLDHIQQAIANENKNNKKDVYNDIEKFIPCKTLENLQELEAFVNENNKNKNKVYEFFKSVGGNGSRDFVIRLMRRVLSNHVGELCSWTGAKNNFKLENLSVIQIMFGVVRDVSGINQKDFEINCKEWLRHAKQRREREERNRSDIE